MFLLNKPNTISQVNNETNIINTINNNIISLGTYELSFALDNTNISLHDKLINNKNPFTFKIDIANFLHLYELLDSTDTENQIKVKVSLLHQGIYTMYTSFRLDYLSKDTKYIMKYVTITKSQYIQNRYVISMNLYINKNVLDEIYDGIMAVPVNYTFTAIRDILIYIFMGNKSLLELKIENIKNTNHGLYKLTKDYMIKPYNYQLENINWCKKLEESSNNQESINLIYGYDEQVKIDSYFILNTNILYLYGKTIVQPENIKSLKYFFHAQGGLLCDNTGLGKTLTLTVHITDDNTKINQLCTDRSNMLLNYIEYINNMTQIEDPKEEELLINKTQILEVLNNEHSMLQDNYKLKTNCNLLIVPVRLLEQWSSEIISYLPSAKIYVINTVRDYNKLKIEDIEKYTLIIITITFLQNEKRLAHTFDLCDILWKRVIVDEVHEIFTVNANSVRNKAMIYKIKGLYKWGISATPSLNLNCENIIAFLTNNIYWENSKIALLSRYRISTDVKDIWKFVNTYYRYNEQTKVKTEVYIPDYEEKIIELEMSNIEKLLYNNATGDTKRMIALCTNYKISSQDSSFSGFTTVSELKNNMLLQHNKTKQDHLIKIENQTKTINYIKELINWFYSDRKSIPEHIKINYSIITGEYNADVLQTQDLHIITDTIDRISRKLDQNEKHIKILHDELKLIETKENMIDNFDNMIGEKLEEPCMICYNNFESVMLTICNHMYCGNCVNEMFKNVQNIKCPMCRTALNRNDINSIVDKNLNLISGDDVKKKLETKEQEDINIHKGGTKINAIIKYVNECDGKIIIFANEKQTLELIAEVFNENKIKYVNLKGNAYVVSKQLKKFKKGEEKVILLSADRANSGTNLTDASHIILLDTHLIVNLTEKNKIEKQAIGRAVRLGQKKNVQVLRFIMKNTIEQIYLNKII
jgi:SNF2 family DNA or RNA helicase